MPKIKHIKLYGIKTINAKRRIEKLIIRIKLQTIYETTATNVQILLKFN